jgi:hypothetical protein
MLTALLVLAVAIGALLAYASTRPPTFRIERSTRIAAGVPRVGALIDNFHEWRQWSPWEALDPQLQRTYSGAEAGTGAVYEWSGNAKAGAGRMEITEMRANAESGVILIKLDFFKPFKASNVAEFVMTPTDDGGTDLQWSMSGPSSFMSRLMGVFMNFDKMVGGDFEKGLAAIKRNAEQAPA